MRVKVGLVWQQRASGPYATLRWTEGGERRSESLGYVTPAVAEQLRGDREAELRLGLRSTGSTPHGRPAVGRLVEEYLRALEDGKRGTATYRRHETAHAIRIDTHLGHLAAHRVTEAHSRGGRALTTSSRSRAPGAPDVRRRDAKLYVRRDKAGRGRGWCPLTEPALRVLREHLATMEDTAPDALVWPSATGLPYTSALIARRRCGWSRMTSEAPSLRLC